MNNLLFFNKDGYSYNFIQDSNGVYNGKLLFDENSSDLFKTLAIYIFEEVPSISFDYDLTLNKFEIYDTSAISFIPETYSGLTITNITNVNTAPTFYSKWIYGTNFDQLFPKGTVVSFSGVTFTPSSFNNEFDKKYYTVLDNKPGAILVNTNTSNSGWTATFVTGGTINSHNIITYNDYDNSLSNYLTAHTDILYTGKKLSIYGSDNNDGVYDYVTNSTSGHTFYQSYALTGVSGDVLKTDFTFYTERTKLYQGPVSFILSSDTAYITFDRGFNSLIEMEPGEQFIFEDYNDQPILPSNPIFTIVDGTTEVDLYNGSINFIKEVSTNATFARHFQSVDESSKSFIESTTPESFEIYKEYFLDNYPPNFFEYDYYLQITGTTTSFAYHLDVDDIIQVSAMTSITGMTTGNTMHEMREFSVKSIQTFKDIRLDYWIDEITNNPSWLIQVETDANTNGVLLETQLQTESLKMYDTKDNDPNSSDYIAIANRIEKIYVNEYTINETNNYYIKKLLKPYQVDTVTCTFSPPITSPIYMEFSKDVIAYDTENVLNFSQTLLSNSAISGVTDYESTIAAYNEKYADYLMKYGILVYYNSGITENINIHSIYTLNPNETHFTTKLWINNNSGITNNTGITNDEVKRVQIEVENNDNILVAENVYPNQPEEFASDYHAEIYFDLADNENHFGLTLTLNDIEFYTGFTTDTVTTLNRFVYSYSSVFYNMGLDIYTGATSGATSGDTLIIDGHYPNVDVRTLSIKVNMFSDYEILTENKNKGTFLSGNVIQCVDPIFYDYQFSTGMIINISGSSYTYNNKNYNIIGLTPTIMELSYQGLFDETSEHLSITSQKYLRKPRESYNKNIYYNFRFVEPFSEDIFFYDITGEHLQPYLGDERLRYIGPLPLWDTKDPCSERNKNITLIDKPNEDLAFVSDPTKQQTQFRGTDGSYSLRFLLDQFDSTDEYNYSPEPLQVFLGFSSSEEGVSNTTFVMEKVEWITFSGYTNSTTDLNGVDFTIDTNGLITITTPQANFNFNDYGFESSQLVSINFIDQRITGTTIFPNWGVNKIEYVGGKFLKLSGGTNSYSGFTTTGNTDGYYYEIIVQPKPILNVSVYGETEVEDERFRVNLQNVGVNLNFDVEHIFVESDINEWGIDYILLNAKRKEMLAVYPEIYNYIGSYKSLINAINFFGWNDLQLYEYYKNVNPNSPLYQKLHRVLIPDIFDNTVEGWTPNDWVKGKYDKGDFKKTNLFNLTYNITDEDGNNTLLYSLDEVQYKLAKLKWWLKKNILPLSTNIIDITGVVDTVNTNYQNWDVSNQIQKIHCHEDALMVNFVFSETLNFENNYLFQLDFYTETGVIPSGWTCKIRTFSEVGGKLIPQKYMKLMKNDLDSYSFNLDPTIDEYIYIETCNYNDRGVGMKYNKMYSSSEFKNYLLINNNFTVPDYVYLSVDEKYYYYDKNGHILLDN